MRNYVADVSVLIVGAGPTGLTLACDLARRHVSFKIIDKAPAFFVGSRGKGLQPRTLEVFDDLGIVGRILSHGRFHLPFRAYDGATVLGDRDAYEGFHPTVATPYASSLIIPQWRVEETLRDLLESSGQRVELGTELIHLEQDENGVTATLQKEGAEEKLRCRYLVAADGGRSFVRKFLQFGFEGESHPDARMFVGDVCVEGLDRDHWHTWPKHADGWLALCPFATTEAFQLQAMVPSGLDEEPSLELFQKIVETRTGRTDIKLSNPTWLSLYRVNIRMVNRYRNGRVFLAGDAAHVHPPTGGQGMNTGIQDSYNLGWKLGLVLGGAKATLLDSYEEERLPVAAGVLGITTRLSREFLASGNQMQRNADTLQLGIHYRGSSLSHGGEADAGGVQAGDRAPDGLLVDGAGKRCRLFDLLRGTRFSLLSFGARDAEALGGLSGRYKDELCTYVILREPVVGHDAAVSFVEEDGNVSNTYQLTGPTWILIRPDGYVGWRGDGGAVGEVEGYLEGVLR